LRDDDAMAIFQLLFFLIFAVDLIAAGGGNAGAPNCWFYQEHFNASLESYQKKVDRWVQHIDDDETVYVAKNLMQIGKVFNKRLDEIAVLGEKMFETYRENILDETAILCGVSIETIDAALRSPSSFAFPVYCLTNIADIQMIHDVAQSKVEEAKNSLKKV
jgi:hypothetical protein